MEISREKFRSYENLRKSGITNMYDLKRVMAITRLTRVEVLEIMSTYSILKEKYDGQ